MIMRGYFENKKHQLGRILKSTFTNLRLVSGLCKRCSDSMSLGNRIILVEQNPLSVLPGNAKINIKSDNLRLIFSRITTQLGTVLTS